MHHLALLLLTLGLLTQCKLRTSKLSNDPRPVSEEERDAVVDRLAHHIQDTLLDEDAFLGDEATLLAMEGGEQIRDIARYFYSRTQPGLEHSEYFGARLGLPAIAADWVRILAGYERIDFRDPYWQQAAAQAFVHSISQGHQSLVAFYQTNALSKSIEELARLRSASILQVKEELNAFSVQIAQDLAPVPDASLRRLQASWMPALREGGSWTQVLRTLADSRADWVAVADATGIDRDQIEILANGVFRRGPSGDTARVPLGFASLSDLENMTDRLARRNLGVINPRVRLDAYGTERRRLGATALAAVNAYFTQNPDAPLELENSWSEIRQTRESLADILLSRVLGTSTYSDSNTGTNLFGNAQYFWLQWRLDQQASPEPKLLLDRENILESENWSLTPFQEALASDRNTIIRRFIEEHERPALIDTGIVSVHEIARRSGIDRNKIKSTNQFAEGSPSYRRRIYDSVAHRLEVVLSLRDQIIAPSRLTTQHNLLMARNLRLSIISNGYLRRVRYPEERRAAQRRVLDQFVEHIGNHGKFVARARFRDVLGVDGTQLYGEQKYSGDLNDWIFRPRAHFLASLREAITRRLQDSDISDEQRSNLSKVLAWQTLQPQDASPQESAISDEACEALRGRTEGTE